jgi:acyl-CoA thioester hydrolase
MREATGAIFVVGDATLRWLQPARLDDRLEITVLAVDIGRASMRIDQQALRGDDVLCEGRIRIACVDAATFRPRRFPEQILAVLTP